MTEEPRPTLAGPRVTVRPGDTEDVRALQIILAEPSVVRWWREPEPADEIEGKLLGSSYAMLLVIEVAGEVAGGIEYHEELDPEYHHAGIDIFLGARWQGRSLGSQAIRLLARFLFAQRGHHRLVIDPAVANTRASAAYAKAGFQ